MSQNTVPGFPDAHDDGGEPLGVVLGVPGIDFMKPFRPKFTDMA
jgi:hypothetical protein